MSVCSWAPYLGKCLSLMVEGVRRVEEIGINPRIKWVAGIRVRDVMKAVAQGDRTRFAGEDLHAKTR